MFLIFFLKVIEGWAVHCCSSASNKTELTVLPWPRISDNPWFQLSLIFSLRRAYLPPFSDFDPKTWRLLKFFLLCCPNRAPKGYETQILWKYDVFSSSFYVDSTSAFLEHLDVQSGVCITTYWYWFEQIWQIFCNLSAVLKFQKFDSLQMPFSLRPFWSNHLDSLVLCIN